jgi:hypothetical protein
MRSAGIVLALVLVCGGTAFAQQPAAFGVKAGVNFANLNFEGEDADVNFDRRTGLVAGLFVVVPSNSPFALQAEALYSQKGAQIEEGGFTSKVRLNVLEVPVLARFSTPASSGASFHVFGGPSLGFKLSAEAVDSFEGEEETTDLDDDVKSFDLGLVLGAGVEFGRLVIDGRYSWGLTDINNDDSEDVKVKTRTFSIMAGFRF